MGFCDREKQLMTEGVTCIDNRFILNYVPDAHGKCVAVYLLGLALADSDGTDNSCEAMAAKLELSPEEVMAAYRYWEELGLVHITFDNPPKVIYLSVREAAGGLKKVKPSKYARFTREMQSVIQGRMITTNEFDQYYTFLENTTFEQDALVAVAKYCAALKGSDINYRYILTVARNLLQKGITTLAVVQEALDSQQKYDEDLKFVFKALGITRKTDHSDREMYRKWSKDYGFTAEVIVAVAKAHKGKGMPALDAALGEYYRKGALSVTEITSYVQRKEKLVALAKEINRTIGVYYQSVDSIIDEYLVGWLAKGYSEETLVAVAKYCFRSGIRTLQGLASIIDKLYKNGITTLEALDEYLREVSQKDEKIKYVLEKCGIERNVTNNDRALFRTWEGWDMPFELVCYAAENAAGTTSPMAYVNRTLSSYKRSGVRSVEQAKAAATTAAPAKKVTAGAEIQRSEYSDEQLNALFTSLEDE